METFFIFVTSFWYLWVLLLISILIRLFLPQIKGFVGEKTIIGMLSFLPKEKYMVLNNVMLKTQNGTTQIDHVVVSLYGVFVIETKNYKGWIYGKESDEYWTQNIYGKKNKFKNPIHQNYGHVKAIENLLGDFNGVNIVPVVAFSNSCDLKINVSPGKVVHFIQINKLIKQYTTETIVPDGMKEIASIILANNVDDKNTRKEHVDAIKTRVSGINQNIRDGICPKCGGTLIRRNGKYGEFTGCGNYPKCRYILK
jgi:hypothetical protein